MGGLLLVGIGGLGIVVPGLPTTVFFIGAAACFARSNSRLEQWVLNLPQIGPMVLDYRDGLGMSYRAKTVAIISICVAVTLSALAISSTLTSGIVVAAGLVGIAYIAARVPTREKVLARRDS